VECWLAGGRLPAVRFACNEPVLVLAGPLAGRLATVVALVALEPEPVYTVRLGAGTGDLHLSGSALGPA
jgi:hypothetical protein